MAASSRTGATPLEIETATAEQIRAHFISVAGLNPPNVRRYFIEPISGISYEDDEVLEIEAATADQILILWSLVVGLNSLSVQRTFLDPTTRSRTELKEPFVWDLEKNITHRQLASLVIALKNANLDADKSKQRGNPPRFFLAVNGGIWRASGGQGGIYQCTLTLGTTNVTAVWDFTINFN